MRPIWKCNFLHHRGHKWKLLCLLVICVGQTVGVEMNHRYICPPEYLRNGNSCYYFSSHMKTWQDAHYDCKDRDGDLAMLEIRWEDRNMKNYLNKQEFAKLGRWIGGIYNWERKYWVWGPSGKKLSYQGFSRRSPNDNRGWRCIMMDPMLKYRWSARNCILPKHYICEAPLVKIQMPDNMLTPNMRFARHHSKSEIRKLYRLNKKVYFKFGNNRKKGKRNKNRAKYTVQ